MTAPFAAALACCLALSACDDGGGGGSEATPDAAPLPDAFAGRPDAGTGCPEAGCPDADPSVGVPCDEVDFPDGGPPPACGTGQLGVCGQGSLLCCAGADADELGCTPGNTVCAGGVIPGDLAEICDDEGQDEDCDGEANEGFTWTDPESGEALPYGEACVVGPPDCRQRGQVICRGGQAACSAEAAAPGEERCDGIDNDCDGLVDEDFEQLGEPCEVGVGSCAAEGRYLCDGEGGVGCEAMEPGGAPASERCDGLDNDCDGEIDEDFPERGVGEACVVGIGACEQTGVQICTADGASITCSVTALAPRIEICGNDIDDDCDGVIDDGFEDLGTPCAVGRGACRREGVLICDDRDPTRARCSEAPGDPLGAEDGCDGVDDDCDGLIDEDFLPEIVACAPEQACAPVSRTVCAAGVAGDACREGAAIGADTTCDGVDDDCNGLVDDAYSTTPIQCGVGACQRDGMRVCLAGQEQARCTPGFPRANDRTCDGVDDDCDGEVDEDYAPDATTCGVGACARRGGTACVDGQVQSTCVPGEPGVDDTCDGVDDDCDGHIDEHFQPEPSECGEGACAPFAVPICVNGVARETCRPGGPLREIDDNCDGVDDDCDGFADEDLPEAPTECGTGACLAQGTAICIGGQISDSCVAGEPRPDTICDGVDQDCDGETDEDYQPDVRGCGIGACRREAPTQCVDGVITWACTPGEPAAELDVTCDGVDDNCNGLVDEGYRRQARECGADACAETAFTTCSDDGPMDTCREGAAAATDPTCDGIDDDCDGIADDDYQPTPITCGVGPCQAQGERRCVAGRPQDECTPGPSQPADQTCDGVDDDCDGEIDEDGDCP